MKSAYLVLFALAIGSVAALAQQPAGPSAGRSKPDTLSQQEESWNAAALDSFFTDFTAMKDHGSSAAELLDRLKGKTEEAGKRLLAGFRVQLAATRDEAEARRAMQDARASFSENTYLLYDNPYYKLRIGDCRTRAEADSLQQRAFERGFAGAWIVRSLVQESPVKNSDVIITPVDSLQQESGETGWR